jgi:hypothetical protein
MAGQRLHDVLRPRYLEPGQPLSTVDVEGRDDLRLVLRQLDDGLDPLAELLIGDDLRRPRHAQRGGSAGPVPPVNRITHLTCRSLACFGTRVGVLAAGSGVT